MQADNRHTRIYLVHVKTRSSCCFWDIFFPPISKLFLICPLKCTICLIMSVYLASFIVTQFLQAIMACYFVNALHFIVLYSLRNSTALYFHPLSWNRTKCNPWPLISVLCFMVYTHTSRKHTHTHTHAHTKSHHSTLSVLLPKWRRGWDKKEEIERDGGGAKSSIIYGWNLIRGRSLDGQRVYWQTDRLTGRLTDRLTESLFVAAPHHHYPVKCKPGVWISECDFLSLCSLIFKYMLDNCVELSIIFFFPKLDF